MTSRDVNEPPRILLALLQSSCLSVMLFAEQTNFISTLNARLALAFGIV